MKRVIYNLEANGNHNYFVSRSKVLAQNCESKIPKLTNEISEQLGEVEKPIINPDGDPIFMSKEGLRKVRWDQKNI